MPHTLREFLLYAAASALALALDMAAFTCGLKLGASLTVAAATGFLLGLALVYVISTRHVFAQHRLADRRLEFAVFAVVGVAGLLVTEAALWLTVAQLHIDPLPAKLTSAGITFTSNFLLRKRLLFTRRRAALQPAR